MTIACAYHFVSLDGVADANARTGAARESSVVGVRGWTRGTPRACAPRLLALLLGLLAGFACLPAGAASTERYPITPEQRETAEKVASRGVALADLAPNAPASYTIKRGDTLWSIATLFLKSPWRWPELWGMNRTQIHNPHLIFPGQTLLLVTTADGRARLVLAGGAPPTGEPAPAPPPAAPTPPAAPPVPTQKLSPRARDLGAEAAAAIPSIPNNQIEPFLSQPVVIAAADLNRYPRIVATPEDRVYLGVGDKAYARGIGNDGVESYHIFRPARPLYDPDDYDKKSPIAFEAAFLGTARVIRRGDVTTLTIVESKREIGVEDRLIPISHQELINYVPRGPERDVQGRIVSVYGGEESAGPGDIVTLNRGSKDGLEVGTVLAVLHNGQTIVDRTTSGDERVKLPDEAIAYVFVFRLFDGISYGLLVATTGPIAVGDRFAPPDAKPVNEAPEATIGPTS